MTPEQRQKIAQAGINRLRFQISQEVGINNKWDMKQAKYFLLNDDKYHYINQ